MEEKTNQNKPSSLRIILIVAIIIVALALIGGGVYLWTQNREDNNPTKTQTTTEKQPSVSPTNVTKSFILSTLGTVPGAKLDYDKAKSLLSKKLQSQFTQDTFVPEFYGIQQGPDGYEITFENINGDTASVKVNAKWGDMMNGWAFNFVKEGGEWKIDEFRNDAQ